MPPGRIEQHPYMDSAKYGWTNIFKGIFKRLTNLENKRKWESNWSMPGMIAVNTVAQTPVATISGDVSHIAYIECALATADFSHTATIKFYLNDVCFYTMYIPSTASQMPWLPSVFWHRFDYIVDPVGGVLFGFVGDGSTQGNVWKCLVAGESGTAIVWPHNPGLNQILDESLQEYGGTAVWECVYSIIDSSNNYMIGRRYGSPVFSPSGNAGPEWAAWTLQKNGTPLGSGSDHIKVCIDTYAGSTAAGFGGTVRCI